jgi:hypothetical protein
MKWRLAMLLVPAAVSAFGVSFGDGTVTEPIEIAPGETLSVADPHAVEFSGGVSMTNATLAVESTDGSVADGSECEAYCAEDSSSEVLFAENMLLASVTNITASMTGESFSRDGSIEIVPATLCMLENDGVNATCQFQAKAYKSSTVRSVTLQFVQSGADVKFKVKSRYYKTDGSLAPGDQLLDESNSGSENSRKQVHLVDIRACCSGLASFGKDTLTLSGPTASTNGTIDIRGTRAAPKTMAICHAEAMPFKGRVNVHAYGQLKLAVAGLSGSYVTKGISRDAVINVHTNGRLLVNNAYQLNTGSSDVRVDGGFVAFAPASSSSIDSSIYFGSMTLRNGARMVGRDPRVRKGGEGAKINVVGETPSYCDTGIILWAESPDDPGVLKIGVDDVTGDGEVDFTIKRSIRATATSGYGDCTVVKTGQGTVRIDGESDYANPTRLQGGTWLLGVSNAMHSQMPVSMEGGSLASLAGTVNSLGALSVSASGSIVVGDGAKIAFADSSAESWNSGAKVDVVADLAADAVRFGTDASALDRSQIGRLRCCGNRCFLDENGFLRMRQCDFSIRLK